MKPKKTLGLAGATLLLAGATQAGTIALDFEAGEDSASINDVYDGETDSAANSGTNASPFRRSYLDSDFLGKFDGRGEIRPSGCGFSGSGV